MATHTADAAVRGDGAGHGGHGHGHDAGPRRSVWLRGSWVRAVWVSIAFGAIAPSIAALIRAGLGWEAWDSEVTSVFALIFWALGFTVGIGCFDHWWGYIIGNPTPAHEDHSSHGAYRWTDYF